MTVELTGALADKAVNTIRMLALDAVEKASCGHPGLPMGQADFGFVLWSRYLRFDPSDPQWPNRDRFVLSAGHGSMLQYALLHLFGYDLSLDDLKKFRQLGSRTPGHPEHGVTPGIETTTGPLGQGFANAVGMAIGARMMAARVNTPLHKIIDHKVYAICSDGDMMEGLSHESASLAGHLGLSNLIVCYDDNHITIEGETELAFSEDVTRRFEAYNWSVQRVDGHDRPAIDRALRNAWGETRRPSLIVAHTHIGYGSPNKQDTAEIHGAAIGPEETVATKRNLNWPLEPTFFVPEHVRELCLMRVKEVKAIRAEWQQRCEEFRKSEPDRAALWDKMLKGELPADLQDRLLATTKVETMATRKCSGNVLTVAMDLVPGLVGGSADLAPSTNTYVKKYPAIARDHFDGRNFHFGIREHAMGGIMNGLALYGGFIPYGATFFVFADYMRPPIRLAAIMRARVIYVFTHDTIFVGEDGPTHEAVEQLASLRCIPGLNVIRPCDWAETAVAWAAAIERRDGPTALILTRQNVPAIDRTKTASAALLRKGAYILSEASKTPADLIIISTGSEVPLAMDVQAKLRTIGIAARVVSMPSMELFNAQPQSYKVEVLPPSCKDRMVIEALSSFGWHKYVGTDGLCITQDQFGVSGQYKALADHFGFTVDKVMTKILAWREGRK